MPVRRPTSPLASVVFSVLCLNAALAAPGARKATDLDGTWEIATDKGAQVCRLVLRAQQSDNGDYFLGMTPACRHAMPVLAKVGRWTMPDATHVTLNEPMGAEVLKLTAVGDTFTSTLDKRTYTMNRTLTGGRSAIGMDPPGDEVAESATIIPVAKRSKPAPEPLEKSSDLAGRYAVMREKRDTGCMLTLDMARAKGGTRAQLAPGCRDQGIVIFDPSAWQLVKGELVLTARAGHKAHLTKSGEGAWQKDPKDGGKPLGLKRL